MTTVYNLWYRHGDRIGGTHVMVVGTYSTEADAKAAQEFLSDKPGFCDYGVEGFSIDPRRIDVTATPGGPVGSEGTLRDKVTYDLWHRREDERGYDHDTLIGVYSSKEKAQQGLALVRDLPQYRDLRDGFEILGGPIDKTYMKEGFFTAYPGEE